MTGITNGLLYQWHTEIQNLKNSVLMLLLKGRLQDFYKDHGIRISTMLEKRLAIQKEFFIFDGDKIKHVEIDGKQIPVFIEGKTMEQYMIPYTELMNQPIASGLVIAN